MSSPAPLQTLSRDLSWLRFNARVLQEAQSPDVPLLERLKFLAIFSSNLDEFFKVRVATLRRLVKLKKKTRAKLNERPKRELRKVLEEVSRQQEEFGVTFREQLLPELHRNHIHLLSDAELTDKQREWAKHYFQQKVRDLLSPVVLDDTLHHLFLKDQTVYLTFFLSQPRDPEAGLADERVLIMELPTKRHGGRFVRLPDEGQERYVLFLDDVIRIGAAELFPGYEQVAVNAIKLSRDAELDIEEEVSGDLMEIIRSSLAKRATGFPARLLFDPEMPQETLQAIKQKTGITDEELVEGGRYHNFRDFFGFPEFDEPSFYYPARPALPHPTLPRTGSLLAAVGQRDHLLHLPYQSFDYVTRLLREAATDPRVSAISITLYRVASKSAVVKALLKAAKHGKQVTAIVELKARFDEESNLFWADKLQRAGANVIFTPPELKVHSKLLLIARREDDESTRRYGYFSTGNFNESTSELYTDHGLFTANEQLTRESEAVFDYLRDQQTVPELEHLLVAPFGLRSGLNALIDYEIKQVHKGNEAYILLKVNSVEDRGMIAKLYEASAAGVRVELLVRGIGCLVPGQPGFSENITQHGLIDRFLEHSRVYVFAHGGEEKVFVSSADWMTRNLDRRVEVAFPILDEALRAEVRFLLDLQRHDTVKARDFDNNYLLPEDGKKGLQAQEATYAWLKGLKRRQRDAAAKVKPEKKQKI
ncbi:polyphosphate kinase 1 [Hymenobacter arizonensis]|uniref:Polyphosphate kinase n=1 Tax=Hymenobacter arizonensis TaxID=1227077 RepID=A0A1I5Y230_HYMAR|nr:polyphosphate kinase 1 [Hymenobacter arizonensis]SFQ38302.1 polyphosphate kinase [Hymenobacter arizonensis]